MAKLKSTKIRVDNINYITYVLKTYYNGTYKFYTYQKNQSSNCYYPAGFKSGTCT